MTSSKTLQGYLKVDPVYSFINEKWTFVVITEQISETASLYLVYVCPIGLWICAYNYLWIRSLMTSWELQISQNFELQ